MYKSDQYRPNNIKEMLVTHLYDDAQNNYDNVQ